MFVSARATMRAADLVVSALQTWLGSWRDRHRLRRRLARGALGLLALSLVGPQTLPWSEPAGSRSADLARAYASLSVPLRPAQGSGTASMSGSVRHIESSYPAPGKRSALIIGINRAVRSRRLHGAVRDAELMREALRRYGFPARNIKVLTDGAATAGRISAELDALAARTPSDGRAVFSFAGHTRKHGGVNQLVAADGRLISAQTLAQKLARVRGPMWVALPTCYAEGYGLPGVVGKNRVATFASDRNELAYELGGSGSWLMIHMVERAMIGARAAQSVEQAFAYARTSIARKNPERAPVIDDRFVGELALGPVTWGPARPSGRQTYAARTDEPQQPQSQPDTMTSAESPQQSPPPSSGGVHVCGRFRYRCAEN